MTDFLAEREKWDQIYRTLNVNQEDEVQRQSNLEFARAVLELLPEGGKTLEAGSGGGWQSLALARTGKVFPTLLDFSQEALNYSQKLFQRENLQARFILEDAFSLGTPDFDLVFNVGVLEHYSHDEQIKLIQAMASRSRKYVLVLMPNAACYWYWIWRDHSSAKSGWPFGKEIPLADLSSIFKNAGLQFIGHKYLASSWTENFINVMPGIEEELRLQILQIHRSKGIPLSHTSYLVAGLGVIDGSSINQTYGWANAKLDDDRTVAELTAAINDLTAINIQSQNQHLENIRRHQSLVQQERLQAQQEHLQVQQELLQARLEIKELHDRLLESASEIDSHLLEKGNLEHEIDTKTQIIGQLKSVIDENKIKLIEVEQSNSNTTQLLQQIHSSRAWRLVQLIWKTRIALDPPGSQRARWLRNTYKLIQKKKLTAPPVKSAAFPSVPSIPDHLTQFVVTPSTDRIFLITRVFFDPSGNNMQFGGAERYLLELAQVIRSIGYKPVILQCGNDHWLRYYLDVPVVGIKVGEAYDLFITELEKLAPKGALAIYSPFELYSEKIGIPAIGISHGVYWDDERYQGSKESLLSTIDHFKAALAKLNTLVSVDTNTLNWFRTVDFSSAQKGEYIPNFVDLQQFSAKEFSERDQSRVVIVFPRRLVKQRGFWLVHDILPAVLDKYSYVEFHFVGKAAPQEQIAINDMVSKYPGLVRWYFLPPEEMHSVYEKADITLIPTIQSEGTSLSCLEAMAAGNAVIASNVGGLPDLIIDGYNGILIEPNDQELLTAITRLIDDHNLRRKLGDRGREVVKNFSLEVWQERWRNVLTRTVPAREPVQSAEIPRYIIFPFGYGIHWNGVKQRPHHLAVQFVKDGYQVYWYTPEGRLVVPETGINLLDRMDEIYVERPILFIYYPQSYLDIGKFIDPVVVYDVLDDISIHDTSGTEESASLARECHEKLLASADIVIASSRLLVDQIKPSRPDVLYVPNAVDINHFSIDATHQPGHTDKHPIIGYHGAIATWFDGQLVAEIARRRPQYKYVMVGPISDDEAESYLKSQSNIQILGAVPYEKLPAQIANFDVGIMPFKLSPLTHAVRPLKILEYLAMHKPVIATPMKEILDWPGVLTAENPDEFVEQIDKALSSGFVDDGTIQNFVSSSTWEQVIKPLEEELSNQINGKTPIA